MDPSANSTLFPAKASGSMQYLRIPAGTSPIHTDCVRALPPLRLSSHQSMGSCLPILPITLPRGSTRSTSGHLRRTCPQDARCRRWARLRGALPRRCWPILWKGKAEFPSSEPTPNQDGGLAAEPTRGEEVSQGRLSDVINSSLGYALMYYHTMEGDMYKDWMNEKRTKKDFRLKNDDDKRLWVDYRVRRAMRKWNRSISYSMKAVSSMRS